MKQFSILQICEKTGLSELSLVHLIENEWISPNPRYSKDQNLDEEDLARIRLILDLKNQFGVNDEAVPLILHLIDQIYYFRAEMTARSKTH